MTHPDEPQAEPAAIWQHLMKEAALAQIPTRREAEAACDVAISVWRMFRLARAMRTAAKRVSEEQR